jgi:EpsI family protein
MVTRAGVIVLCIAAAYAALAPALRQSAVVSPSRLAEVPLAIADWRSAGDEPLDARTAGQLGAEAYLNRAYRRADEPAVGVYVGYYARQRQAATIHSPLNCLPGSGWTIVSHETVPVGTRPFRVSRLRVRNDASELLVLYWYESHGRVLASEYWSKAYLVFDALRLRRTDGALVRVTTPVLEWDPYAERTADRRAREFADALLPIVARYLPA